MKRITMVLALVLMLALAGCVPVPQPEQPAAAGVNVETMRALNVRNDLSVGGTISGASSLVMEGATSDDYETTFAVTDPTADRTITFPNSTGTVALNPYGASIEFEGTTADEYETTLAVTDPTADVTLTLPKETATVMVSSLTTNATDAANAVTGASNGLVFEGTTANNFETTLAASDPSNDRTITLPNASGTLLLTNTPGSTVFGSNVITGTLAINHGLTTPQTAFCTMGADPVDNQEDRCTVTLSGATVTVKVWKEAASPTAGDSGVLVFWQVAGQP